MRRLQQKESNLKSIRTAVKMLNISRYKTSQGRIASFLLSVKKKSFGFNNSLK